MMTVDEALRHERDRLPFELERESIYAMETLAAEVRLLREQVTNDGIQIESLEHKLESFREENERLRKDAERLDWIANEYAHIEPFGIPTGEGDSETGWKVSQEQCGQIKPKQLSVVYKDSLRESIDAARGAK